MALTNQDLKNIKQLVEVTIAEDETLVRKEDLRHLPTKDEFYGKMDEVMGELKAIREDHQVLTHQVSGHEDRIVTIEHKVGIQTP